MFVVMRELFKLSLLKKGQYSNVVITIDLLRDYRGPAPVETMLPFAPSDRLKGFLDLKGRPVS